jgi:hypothetical protein
MAKSNVLSGLGLSTIDWTWAFNMNIFGMTTGKWDDFLFKMFRDCDGKMDEMVYLCEKNKSSDFYHTHVLTKGSVSKEELIELFKRYTGSGEEVSYSSSYICTKTFGVDEDEEAIIEYDPIMQQAYRFALLKGERILVSKRTGEKIVQHIDERVRIPFHEIRGNDGKAFLEPVVKVRNISLYSTKYANATSGGNYFNLNSISAI